MEKKALGKGIFALIPEKAAEQQSAEGVAVLNIAEIGDNSFQPRTNYDKEKLEELKASIRDKGVLQPIIVRKRNNAFEVVAGERRLRAARELHLKEIPVIIKELSDDEALVIALIENIQREELNPIEEAEAFQRLIDQFKFTQESVAQSVGKDRSTIGNLLRLLKLPEKIKQGVYRGDLSMGHARTLLGLDSTGEQVTFFDLTITKNLSVRELENLIKSKNKKSVRRQKEAAGRIPQVIQVEEGLQKILGTKVRIDHQKKRGKITIDYYSIEDLERIVKLIIK